MHARIACPKATEAMETDTTAQEPIQSARPQQHMCTEPSHTQSVFQPLDNPNKVVLLSSKLGNFVHAPEGQYRNQTHAQQDEFKHMLHLLQHHTDFSMIRYAQWLLFGFTDPTFCQSVYDVIIARSCDIVGVCVYGDNRCSAIARRSQIRKKFGELEGFGIDTIYSVKSGNDKYFNNTLAALFLAWLNVGIHTKANVTIEPIHQKEFSWHDLEKEWAGVSEHDINQQIMDAEEFVSLKRPHTTRDVVAANMGRKILRRRSDLVVGLPSYMIHIGSQTIIQKPDFENMHTIVCRSIEVIQGRVTMYPLDDWCSDRYLDHTLIIHGGSELGKTELAKTLMCEVASALQQGAGWIPYIVKTETVDSLKMAVDAGHLGSTIPIILDEIKIGVKRGRRPSLGIEDATHLCEMRSATTVDARVQDIKIAEREPRCFTCNASEPHAWPPDIPHGLFSTVSALERQSLPSDVNAVLKRTTFAHVIQRAIPQSLRDTCHASRRAV